MPNLDPHRLLHDLSEGTVSIAELTGLGKLELQSIAYLGRAAFEAGRFDQSARIFAGLEALEATNPEHALCRAFAEARAARREEAVAAIGRYLEADAQHRNEDVIDALMLRASLIVEHDPTAAKRDMDNAKMIKGGAR